MSNNPRMVGFDRKVSLNWLDATAELASQGLSFQEIKDRLEQILKSELSDTGNRSAKSKTLTVLLRIWVAVRDDVRPFRDQALNLIREQPHCNRVPLHWGLCLAAYPFFHIIAETAGRLLTLQGTFTASQVQRRVKETFGERETVTYAVRRVLRSIADWGVIEETGNSGVYKSATPQVIHDTRLAVWLIESVLVASEPKYGMLSSISQTPSLFPFVLKAFNIKELEENDRLEVLRHGLDQDVIKLRANWASR
ncbi:MAG TPA: hypothetical protein VF131_02525 [Blastocatellia bacterium]|nr:hypothetical protein [Blastocatellia bacterium]